MGDHYQKVLEKLNKHYSQIERYYGYTLYKVSKTGYVYLRYSKKNLTGIDKYFFGLEKDAIDVIKEEEFSVIFVCGDPENIFIVNKDVLFDIIKGIPLIRNQWKINIFSKGDDWTLKVTGKPYFEIGSYKNRYDLIFSKILETVKLSSSLEIETESYKREIIYSEELVIRERLKIDLQNSSRNSKEPALFENAVLEFLKYFGFECEKIGKSGTTDILLKSPISAIIEVKSRAKGKIDKIYFPRLKQHREKHNAKYIAVVCNDFSPAAIRDAIIEESTLIKTESLCDMLEIDEDFPLSPTDFEIVFSTTGLLEKNHMKQFHFKEIIQSKLQNLSIILNSVDNEKRILDEIFGRYQIKCREVQCEILPKTEFSKFLGYLSMTSFMIVEMDGNKYFRIIPENIALERLKKIGVLYNIKLEKMLTR